MHRVETIMQTIESMLGGLATTGNRVYRGRAFAVPEEDQNAILVYQGGDDKEVNQTESIVESILEVVTVAFAVATADQADTVCNQIREEINIELAARVSDLYALGYVKFIEEQGAVAPHGSADGKELVTTMVINWIVIYERDLFNPS